MSYQKQNFANGQVLTAEHLNKMEEGIAEARETAATQPDWNETDETSPAFIMNKPVSLGGGSVCYYLSLSDVASYTAPVYKDTMFTEIVQKEEFIGAYNKSLVMIHFANIVRPCLGYGVSGTSYLTLSYLNSSGNAITQSVVYVR